MLGIHVNHTDNSYSKDLSESVSNKKVRVACNQKLEDRDKNACRSESRCNSCVGGWQRISFSAPAPAAGEIGDLSSWSIGDEADAAMRCASLTQMGPNLSSGLEWMGRVVVSSSVSCWSTTG